MISEGENSSSGKKEEEKIFTHEEISKMKQESITGNGKCIELVKAERTKEIKESFALRILHSDLEGEYLSFVRESSILSDCSHPCVLKIYNFIDNKDTKSPPTMVLSFAPFNLANEITKLSNTEKVQAVVEIMFGMRFLQEKKNIIHRNLKPENILLTKNKHIKISDFKRAVYQKLDDTNVSDEMTFMAPELLDENRYVKRVDQYAFGKLLYFILTNGNVPEFNLKEVVSGKKFPIPDTIPEFGRKMIEDCCNYEQDKRPTFKTLLETAKANDYAFLPGVEVIDIKYRLLQLERKEKSLS